MRKRNGWIPMFHFTERRIEAHVCICFMALKVHKELERLLRIMQCKISVDEVIMRLHERDKAKEILNEMINRLSADGDYTEEVSKLKSILDILK